MPEEVTKEPDNQELSNSNIPKAEENSVQVKKKVLAGESMGSQSPVYKIPPTIFFGFAIDPGAQFYQDQDLQKSRNVFSCFSTHCCVRTREYGGVSMWNKSFSKKLRCVIIAGELVGEQVIQ
ncbi:hypothetical protein Bca52824_052416 [Brassica carinata]|uniref:Uncharacterized protein n=1 Tax=Brassica carinata TaxID=52824 RepID=A0A8X7UMB0_BRACI|nr:hypothetical protein Bca52824_052416 [Brassica carinata]